MLTALSQELRQFFLQERCIMGRGAVECAAVTPAVAGSAEEAGNVPCVHTNTIPAEGLTWLNIATIFDTKCTHTLVPTGVTKIGNL
ncbi:hypothetical protein CYMTET_53983 [Cymbomonas tetramitiformis]|uniref:Uncharacterized protein n=1 Tax=Cymbomonas tetramitiformis TaxID=36881 RepID=A0AAE0BFU4_9CHLO|nr:hypothetical protein CYMTET_53983 [Cymbomonas tetramitiformis]